MKNYKNYLIVILGALLTISLLTSSNKESTDSLELPDLKNYQTKEEMKEVIGTLVVEISRLEGRINELQNCMNNLEVDPGGSGREVVCL